MSEKKYYVYIATNFPRRTVLYTGFTGKLIARDGQHKEKFFENSFTAKYNVNRIVYIEIYGEAGAAIAREKAIKRLLRRKKIEMIEKENPEWKDLLDGI